MSVKVEDNTVIVSLNKLFYTEDAINQTIEDFSEICKIELQDSDSKFNLTIVPEDISGIDVLGQEICNYVLGLMQNNLT